MFKSLVPKIIKYYTLSIIIIITIFLFSEALSLQNTILDIAFYIREAAEESCDFFTQESYLLKQDADQSVRGNSYSIYSKDGNYEITGTFYDSNSYKSILQNNFTPQFISNLESKIMASAISNENTQKAMKNNSYIMLKDIMNGNSKYVKYGITPANLGFTYLDKNTLQKIFRWRLVNKLTTNGIDKDNFNKRNTILTEDGINYFIKYKGFRIYLNNIEMFVEDFNNIHVLNLSKNDDKQKFCSLTGISDNYFTKNGLGNVDSDKDIRNYKIVYDVRWNIKIGYEGILPLALVYKVLSGNSNTTLDVDRDTTIHSVLNGDDFNTELTSFDWNTSQISNVDYTRVTDSTLWAKNNYIPIAQRCIYTIIN